nr:immunoglobulin heavy chain junction region [Mus musculus]
CARSTMIPWYFGVW